MKMPYFFNLTLLSAIIAFIAALMLSIFLRKSAGAIDPILLFLPAIVLFALRGGYKFGIATTVLSAAVIYYLFIVNGSLHLTSDPVQIIKMLVFLSEGIMISLIIERGRQRHTLTYHRLKKELTSRINQLEAQYIAAKKEIRSRDEFLSIASHELKTPLTSMLLQTQTALYNIKNVSLAHFSIDNLLKMLESVENQTKRLSKMINDLLSTSVITTGNLQLVYEKVDLDAVVSDVLEDFSTRIQQENIELIYTKQESIIGRWDKIRIEQAVSNLISNAIKYGDKKPIEVATRREDNVAVVAVTDHGIGIPREQHDRIFGLFERAVSPTEYKGLGVGLYITKQIVLAHRGSIALSSKIGKGTTFTIKLPL